MVKKIKGKEPEWLDEDPDEKSQKAASEQDDPYGSMTDYARFHSRSPAKIEDDAARTTKSPQPKGSLAQFCGQWGMRFEGGFAILDLHGMRLSPALDAVDRAIQAILDDKRIKRLRIITGRGSHSEDGVGVLARDVHPHVENVFTKFIEDIDVSPADLIVRGFPAKGHFDVRFK